jgi:hypothetical protein
MYGLNVVREPLTYDSLVPLGCLYVETTKECIMFEVIVIFGGWGGGARYSERRGDKII